MNFQSFVVAERQRHLARLRFAVLLTVLIAAVIEQTQFLSLRPGLYVLLAGQVGTAFTLAVRSFQLAKDVDAASSGRMVKAAKARWFHTEKAFLSRAAGFETGCQALGFLYLGYALWRSTGSLLLAVGVGIAYPASAYFGMTRGRNLKAMQELERAAAWQLEKGQGQQLPGEGESHQT